MSEHNDIYEMFQSSIQLFMFLHVLVRLAMWKTGLERKLLICLSWKTNVVKLELDAPV